MILKIRRAKSNNTNEKIDAYWLNEVSAHKLHIKFIAHRKFMSLYLPTFS